jgi:hypothetical protein
MTEQEPSRMGNFTTGCAIATDVPTMPLQFFGFCRATASRSSRRHGVAEQDNG